MHYNAAVWSFSSPFPTFHEVHEHSDVEISPAFPAPEANDAAIRDYTSIVTILTGKILYDAIVSPGQHCVDARDSPRSKYVITKTQIYIFFFLIYVVNSDLY